MQYFGFDRPSFAFKTYGFGANPDAAILALFAGGKQGVWYDPSDKSTLFQDVAGAIPVTKDGDPIGLMKDKSGNGNHATQSVSTARPLYKTDGTLHWFESDEIDDGFFIPVALNQKTFTTAISYLRPLNRTSMILMNSDNQSVWAYSANKGNSSGINSSSATLNFIKVNSRELSVNTRGELYNELEKGCVLTGSSFFNNPLWGQSYQYGLFQQGVLKGLSKTTGYILIENLTDTTELDKYLANKSGVTL